MTFTDTQQQELLERRFDRTFSREWPTDHPLADMGRDRSSATCDSGCSAGPRLAAAVERRLHRLALMTASASAVVPPRSSKLARTVHATGGP